VAKGLGARQFLVTNAAGALGDVNKGDLVAVVAEKSVLGASANPSIGLHDNRFGGPFTGRGGIISTKLFRLFYQAVETTHVPELALRTGTYQTGGPNYESAAK